MISVRLEGAEKVTAIAQRANRLKPVVERAVFAEATTVLNESKRIVPVRNGDLRRSGAVETPKTSGGRTTVEISYGGAAAGYALYVHEIPPSSGGRWGTGNKHKDGKTYKYLEIPANAHRDKFVRNVMARIAGQLRKGR